VDAPGPRAIGGTPRAFGPGPRARGRMFPPGTPAFGHGITGSRARDHRPSSTGPPGFYQWITLIPDGTTFISGREQRCGPREQRSGRGGGVERERRQLPGAPSASARDPHLGGRRQGRRRRFSGPRRGSPATSLPGVAGRTAPRPPERCRRSSLCQGQHQLHQHGEPDGRRGRCLQ
jgi:hypothetical protein